MEVVGDDGRQVTYSTHRGVVGEDGRQVIYSTHRGVVGEDGRQVTYSTHSGDMGEDGRQYVPGCTLFIASAIRRMFLGPSILRHCGSYIAAYIHGTWEEHKIFCLQWTLIVCSGAVGSVSISIAIFTTSVQILNIKTRNVSMVCGHIWTPLPVFPRVMGRCTPTSPVSATMNHNLDYWKHNMLADIISLLLSLLPLFINLMCFHYIIIMIIIIKPELYFIDSLCSFSFGIDWHIPANLSAM